MSDEKVKVWDPFVRVFHWVLFLAFTAAFLTNFGQLRLHVFAGYAVALLVALRAVWGVIGGKNARFSDFVYPPAAVVAHVRDMARLRHRRYMGHNPAAGAMAIVLMICLAATALTGVLTYGAKEVSGPFAAVMLDYGWRYGRELEDVHHFLAALTALLAVFHVSAAALESVLHRENLILSMVTGSKRREKETKREWEQIINKSNMEIER